jgi:hypothetical protein
MAQRKSPPTTGSGSRAAGSPGKPGKAGKGQPAKALPPRGGGRPPAKKGKSIVNQKQTPWGLIATTAAVVLFAVAVVVVVIVTRDKKSGGGTDSNDPYRQPALAAAMKIKGVTYHVEGNHDHDAGVLKYDATPPIGGNHSPIWANCNGAVYDHQIANENAVHMLEHGAVWITYNPKTLAAGDLAKLKTYVVNQDRLALSPYDGLKTPISLQAWGYQLFVSSADDARITQFIATLKYNSKTTPEKASCTDPYWNAAAAKASRPGHPVDQPVK